MIPANRRSRDAGEVSTPYEAVSTPKIYDFVSGLLDLYIYRRISDLGVAHYPSEMRRDLDDGLRVNSRSALAVPVLPISDQWMRVGFPHRVWRYRPGGSLFCPWAVGFENVWPYF